MIASVAFTAIIFPDAEGDPPSPRPVTITMDDGTVWNTDAALPPDNEIRRALADWLAAGGVITPYAPPPVTARAIHKAYLRAALAETPGRLAAVDAAAEGAGSVTWELWANATEISEADPDVVAIAAALAIDLAALFNRAFAIRASRGG